MNCKKKANWGYCATTSRYHMSMIWRCPESCGFCRGKDFNECRGGDDFTNCDDNAVCTNIVGGAGSFKCTCKAGYHGDGITCKEGVSCYTGTGVSYVGVKSKTIEGDTCQRWDRQTPHTHTMKASQLPDKSLTEAENYCRNDGSENRPWCYTRSRFQRWQFCDIPKCQDCYTGSGKSYVGKESKTEKNKTCQRWDSQTPHTHGVTSALLPDKSLAEAANYCRNDGSEPRPWCYTTNKDKRWEFCDIPKCTE